MKNFKIKNISLALALLGGSFMMNSCIDDLKQEPITEITAASLYKDFGNYKNLLAKLYGGLAIAGQEGGDGQGDIADIDGGFSNYFRLMFYMQEVTTDEAVIGWNDGTLPEFHKMSWTPANEFNNAMYYRLYTEIAFCNEFIKNTTDEMLSSNGISGSNADEAKVMRAEARFLRAQTYYHLLDLYGNVPFVDETTLGTVPKQMARAELFKYVESELLASAADLKPAKSNEYGRLDQGAAYTLLARLYLNAKVYTGTERNADVIANTQKVISAGYALNSKYENLFLADNNLNNPENIFSIVYDLRGRFYKDGQTLEINDLGNFNDGYAFIKYKNIKSNGAAGVDTNWVEADLSIYRLADVYLMYAEAVLRGGGGNMATAVGYINALRTRANASPVSFIDLNFILDERSREMSWENTRRTDLIRYGRFTSATYLWPWKGNAKDGIAVGEHRNLFPIPNNDLVVNPNLEQNPGY